MAKTISFSDVAKDVMTARKNFGAPEVMRLKESVKSKDMIDKVITIDCCVVSNKAKTQENKEGKREAVLTKDGKQVYEPIVYIAFDNDYFFATKSAIMLDQIVAISGMDREDVVIYDKTEVEIKALAGAKVKIGTEKVKYRDGKEYDQPILTDA